MVFGVIVAGGTGSRMGADMPKQFLTVAGKPIIEYPLDAFLGAEGIDQVIVMCHPDWVSHARDIADRLVGDGAGDGSGGMHDRPCVLVAAGGDTRNDTIMNAIALIEEKYGLEEETILVTHDAVRPFVTRRMIEDNLKTAKAGYACITAVPATDTIARSELEGVISDIPDREGLYQIQTPQSFKAARFREIYSSMGEQEKDAITDAGRVMLAGGDVVRIVPGENYNIKITFPWDMDIAEALAKRPDGTENDR